MTPEATGDRRPIATRKLRVSQACARALATRHVPANAISVAGMICGAAAGACLVATSFAGDGAGGWGVRILFLAAAGGIQLRLLANMLDGMVAIASGTASALGELYNEIPDRVSDTLILAGAGYALGGDPALGWAAALVAMFVTYIRALGKGMGVPGLFQGPMSKSHRMFTLTVTCVYLGAAPGGWQPMWRPAGRALPVGIVSAALALIIVGGLVTAGRRLMPIVRACKERGR